jgi:tetratricopeptide (TPR) repeat protein
MAIQTYSTGNPHDAVGLVRTAQGQAAHHTTPRMKAMLHARTARALSKTNHGQYACARELDLARDAFAQGPHDDDPPFNYWMTAGEIEMLAGSCALDLGEPARALTYFDAAHDADYSVGGYVRDQALFLTRRAEALLALGQVEEACATARDAFEQSGGVDSTRPIGAIADFRKRLTERGWSTSAVGEFLELTA